MLRRIKKVNIAMPFRFSQQLHKLKKRLPLLVLALLFVTSLLSANINASSDSPWIVPSDPWLHEVSQYPSGYTFPTMLAGKECFDGKVVTRPSRPFQSEQSHTGCLSRLTYGSASNTGYLYLNNSSVAGKFENYLTTISPITIPNSTTIISQAGSSLNFTKNVTTSLNTTVNPDGSVLYKVNRAADGFLRDKAGNALPYRYDTINFSENGKWVVVDSPYVSMLRINLETFEVLPFRSPFVYGMGFDPYVQATITNDGRHVFVRSISSFEVFDLSTCGAVPNVINGPVSCSSKSLLEFIKSQKGNEVVPPLRMRFVDDQTLSMSIRYGASTPQVLGKFLLTSSIDTQPTQLQYLALGDSFASGEGAYQYEPGTDTAENKCHLSIRSYPYLISQDLGFNSFRSIACSGAKLEHITSWPQMSNTPDPNPLGIWLPGDVQQIMHVARSQPSTITISIIGNDIGFSSKLSNCVLGPSTCFNSYKDRKEIVDEVNKQYEKLKDGLSLIKSRAAPTTKIYVTGYPQLAMENGNCGNNVLLSNDEVILSNKLINHLNYVVQQASAAAGVRYVDITNAFNGHRLCEPITYVAVNGFNLGTATPIPGIGPSAKESYHPNEFGHRLLRGKVLQATSNLTLTNPSPVVVTPPNASVPTAQALLSGFVDSGETIRSTQFNNKFINDLVYRNSNHNVSVDSTEHALKPSSSYTVELHSNHISLGTFSTDGNGDLNFNITIPNTVEPGYHTLHIFGQNRAGEAIDIYKGVYVGATESDFDGDGTLNEDEACIAVEPANEDADEDGIDDGCDGFIDLSPTKVSQLYRIRNGNVANGEPEDKIFVERKVQIANELFGISDYDPDGDGWSVVGESDTTLHYAIAHKEVKNIGLTAEMTDRFVPRIWIRHPEKGCTILTPGTLDEVTSSSATSLLIDTEDTDGCRQEAPSADTDNDGVADELQTLYRARNGNFLLGEDPYKIYIERNVVAAEAVLGLSDYDADGNGWVLVGVSDQILSAEYNRMLLADNTNTIQSANGAFTSAMLSSLDNSARKQITPIALYRELFLQCKALKPTSLSTVKLNETTVRSTMSVSGFENDCN